MTVTLAALGGKKRCARWRGVPVVALLLLGTSCSSERLRLGTGRNDCDDCEVLATGNRPFGITLSGDFVYWSSFEPGQVARTPRAGGPTELLYSGAAHVPHLLVSEGALFFTTDAGDLVAIAAEGAPPEVLFRTDARVWGLAGDARTLYFTAATRDVGGTDGKVYRFDVPTRTATELVNGVNAFELVVDAAEVFFTAGEADQIWKVPATGGAATLLAEGQEGAWGITLSGDHVVWANHRLGTLMQLPRSGGTPALVATEQAGAHSVIDDAGTLYWTAEAAGAVVRKRANQAPVPIASGQLEVKNLAVDSAYVYWTTHAGNVMRARK